MKIVYKAGAICLLLMGAAMAQNPSASLNAPKDQGAVSAPQKPQVPAQAAPGTDDPSYVIGAEDVLSIAVWKEPDVSGTVTVRPDGKISISLLNDVQAAGLTPMQLRTDLTERLKKFISEPQVTVTVTASNSRRVFILGEVQHAGALPLIPNMTVLQAISAAGGMSPFANTKGVYVLRSENGKQNKYPVNYKEIVKGRNPEQNLVLRPGDTIVVP